MITLPDSLCWLLNIRGADVARNPIVHGFAILHLDARVTLFADAGKFDDARAGASWAAGELAPDGRICACVAHLARPGAGGQSVPRRWLSAKN